MAKYKIVVALLIFLVASIGGYLYVYQGHRDISNEKESFSVNVDTLYTEFMSDEFQANEKYLDKTISVSGRITKIDYKNKSIVINEKLFALFDNDLPASIKPQLEVEVKWRLLGYDSLLEEIKLDQCVIVN
jgi:autonomous glycyl radical cofactor GrcA